MKKLPRRITPEMLAKMSSEEKRELMLLLEALDRPKLARVTGAWPPSSPLDLRASIEAGNKRVLAMSPEERAAAAEQEARDEAELLDWYENRGGKSQQLHPIVEAHLRVARARRGDFDAALEAAQAKIEAENAAARATKPAEPEVKQEQDEPLKTPVIETEERKPTSIMEALNRPTPEPMQIGESLGSFFIRIRP